MISSAQREQLAADGAPLSDEFDPSAPCKAPAPARPWVEEISEHLAWVLAHPVHRADRTGPVSRPSPFERVLAGFVSRAAAGLRVDADILAGDATLELERWLLERLLGLSKGVLDLELSAYKASRGTSFEHLAAGVAASEDSIGEEFADRLLQGGLVDLALEYPTWARLVCEVMSTWRSSVEEFVARLVRDRSAISVELCAGGDLGPVTRLACGFSDPHNGGRSVLIIGFASRNVVVYKPRDMRPEAAFGSVLHWLSRRGASEGPRPLKVLEREGYGWMQFAPAAGCQDRSDIARYYRRAGGLLCLAYALCGTDCHFENIVASGSRLALVDAETLLHTVPARSGQRRDAVIAARAILNDSVFSTAMLPIWRVLPDGSGYDNSGLGIADRQRVTPKPRRSAGGSATGRADGQATIDIGVLPNVPRLDGVPVAADDHVPEIIDGFTAMYRTVLTHRDDLCATSGPLEMFRPAEVRVVLRPTQLYAGLLAGSLRPTALRNGARHWQELRGRIDDPDAEARPRRLTIADPQVLLAELQALEHLDIPRFTVRADRPIVTSPPSMAGSPTGAEAGLARTTARIRAMSEADLARQVSFIRGAFHCRAAARPETSSGAGTTARGAWSLANGSPSRTRSVEPEEAKRLATTIAERIHQLAIFGADGTVTWIVPAFEDHGRRYLLRPMGHDLYGGTAGVGLFLAALSHLTGDSAHRELAIAAIRPLGEAAGAGFPIGGLNGLGSMVYTLVTTARLLDRPDFLEQACAVARLIDRQAIERDQAYDLVNGSAGAALALLSLARATGDDQALETARACAEHLLAASTGTPAGWSGDQGLLTGCAHGAAGIAHALFRVAADTGDARYRDAASEALGFENEQFDPTMGTWPDLRSEAPTGSFMHGWCSGAPGIGLARLSSSGILAQSAIDLRRAVRKTLTTPLGRRDHLCCGNLGRAAFLAEAARHLDDPDLFAAATAMTRAVLDRAAATGAFALVNDPRAQADHVGFFQGTAGIGFQLLRLAYPEVLPLPLLIE